MDGLGVVTKEEEEMISFLRENFNPFLESLIVDIVKERPNDSYEYILKWLDTKGRDIQSEIDKRKISS